MGRTRTALSDIAADRAADGDPWSSRAGVVVRLSPDAQKILAGRDDQAAVGQDAFGSKADAATAEKGTVQGTPKKLSDEDRQLVSRLAARDTAVHAHEAAHQAAARGLGGAASFTYETGPDGRRYAVGGEVPVSLRPGRTPQETIANAQTVRSAALAPADPSSQDLAVASQASQMEAEAHQEITEKKVDGDDGNPLAHAKISAPGAGDGDRTATPRTDGGERDPLMVFSTLKTERSVVNGHPHISGAAGCAFCSAAAARYA